MLFATVLQITLNGVAILSDDCIRQAVLRLECRCEWTMGSSGYIPDWDSAGLIFFKYNVPPHA